MLVNHKRLIPGSLMTLVILNTRLQPGMRLHFRRSSDPAHWCVGIINAVSQPGLVTSTDFRSEETGRCIKGVYRHSMHELSCGGVYVSHPLCPKETL